MKVKKITAILSVSFLIALMSISITATLLAHTAENDHSHVEEMQCAENLQNQHYEQDCNGDGIVVQYQQHMIYWTDTSGSDQVTINSLDNLPYGEEDLGDVIRYDYHYRACDDDAAIRYSNYVSYPWPDCQVITYAEAVELLQ